MLNAGADSVANTKSILIVEDDLDIQEALKDALEFEGYDVEVAGDGRIAIDRLHSSKDLPTLILLDLMLPFVTGWEVLDHLKKDPDSSLASIPVIVTTAAGNTNSTFKHPVEAHLKKPIDLDTLLNHIAQNFNRAV